MYSAAVGSQNLLDSKYRGASGGTETSKWPATLASVGLAVFVICRTVRQAWANRLRTSTDRSGESLDTPTIPVYLRDRTATHTLGGANWSVFSGGLSNDQSITAAGSGWAW